MEQAQFGDLLRRALARLSEACQELLTLRFFSDLTYEEIARKLGGQTTRSISKCSGA